MREEMKDKRVVGLNIPYFLMHAKEIIEDTTLMNPEYMQDLSNLYNEDYYYYYGYWNRKFYDSGNAYMFGRGQYFMNPGETRQEALNRIDHEYCEETGRWDLYIWVDEESYDRKFREHMEKITDRNPYAGIPEPWLGKL